MRITIPADFDDFKRLGLIGQSPEYRERAERDTLHLIFRAGLTAIEKSAAKGHAASAPSPSRKSIPITGARR